MQVEGREFNFQYNNFILFFSIENPDRSNSFEEELFRGLPRDDVTGENEDDDVIRSDEIKRSSGQRLSAAR